MKDFIIAIFSPLLQVNVIVSTIGGFILGGIVGGLSSSPFGGASFNSATAFVGAIIAFSNAAIVSGAGLALDRIRELLEEQNYQLRTQGQQERPKAAQLTQTPVHATSTMLPPTKTQVIHDRVLQPTESRIQRKHENSKLEVIKRHRELEENAKVADTQGLEQTSDGVRALRVVRIAGEEAETPDAIATFYCAWCEQLYSMNVNGGNLVFRCVKCERQLLVTVLS